jgi:Domain of unknown function (DUF4214)
MVRPSSDPHPLKAAHMTPFDRNRPIASVDDLLHLDDQHFIHQAYLSVLRRPADPSGFAVYLKQLRSGADKEQLIASLATSAEAKLVTEPPLTGLPELVERAQRNRPPLWLKALRRALAQLLQPLMNQQAASEQRLHDLSAAMHTRFDQLETLLTTLNSGASTGASAVISPQEREALQHTSEHAREIYFQLKDAVAHKKRVSLQ